MNSSAYQSAIFPGRYIQGPGAIKVLPEWISKLGSKSIIVGGKTAIRDIIPELKKLGMNDLIVEPFGGECTQKEVDRITEIANREHCDVAIAIGGGKVIDTVKVVALLADAKTIIVPTIASNDAPCSAISIIYTESGAFDHIVYLKQNPNLVVLDSEIIAKAPVRLLVAGMGDGLSTWFEADACFSSGAPNETGGGRGTLSALALARLCFDTILENGSAAIESCKANQVSPALERIIEANTLMSGLGFESAGLASAHSIHNGLTQLASTHSFFHGEKVAFGVLAGMFLANRPVELINRVYDFCESVGLPVTLVQIGVVDPSEEDLRKVAEAACAPGESIWHEPSKVTPERVIECIKKADSWRTR
jgi:glycerol dehydrogenase